MHNESSILLIGSGRLAKHLKHWNQLTGHTARLVTWQRNQDISQLKQYLNEKPLVWLAISDSSIIKFYEEHLALDVSGQNLRVVHFSGALHDSRLISAHPLMSFSENLFADSFYDQIHFVINNCENLQEALPGFKNPFTKIMSAQKAFYHALCVISGNFPQLLWSEIFKEADKLGIPEEAFEIYIKKITENFIELKEAALTGPLIRKDNITIEKNIAALENNLKLQNIYEIFAKEFKP